MKKTSQHTNELEQLDAKLFRGEDTELTSTLSDLRSAATASAEQMRHVSITPRRMFSPMLWVFAAATMLVCGIGIRIHQRPQPMATPVVAQQASPNINDDVLLADIQDDLSASVPTPMLPLTLTQTTTQRK